MRATLISCNCLQYFNIRAKEISHFIKIQYHACKFRKTNMKDNESLKWDRSKFDPIFQTCKQVLQKIHNRKRDKN